MAVRWLRVAQSKHETAIMPAEDLRPLLQFMSTYSRLKVASPGLMNIEAVAEQDVGAFIKIIH